MGIACSPVVCLLKNTNCIVFVFSDYTASGLQMINSTPVCYTGPMIVALGLIAPVNDTSKISRIDDHTYP
jgi:hypothetical protein